MRAVPLLATLSLAFLAGWWGRALWEEGDSSGPAQAHLSSDLGRTDSRPLLRASERSVDSRGTPAGVPAVAPEEARLRAADGAAPSTPDGRPPTSLDAARALIGRVRPLLLAGKPVQLDLWRLLEAVAKAEDHEWLNDDSADTAAARHVWDQFLAQHRDEVAVFIEGVFQRMLETQLDPDDVSMWGLAILAPDLGAHLIAVLPPTRLRATRDTLRRLVLNPELLAAEDRSSVRADLEGILSAWAGSGSAAEARSELQRGQTTAREALALLERIPPHEVSQHDPIAAVVRLLKETGDWMAFQRRLYWLREVNGTYGAGELERLDTAALAYTRTSQYTDHGQRLQRYLSATSRGGWPEAEAFVAGVLEAGGRAPQHVPALLRHLSPKAPARYVQLLLDRYEFTDHVRTALKELLK